MAKAIATITGTALRPGVSRNKRWYKPEHVAGAVASAQRRLAEGRKPMVMLTFHEAGDDSREIAASLASMSLAEDGSASFTANLTDTAAGRDIAKLVDTSDGKPAHLKNVSIRGAWTGKVRKEPGPDGQMAETADGLELFGIDFTKEPGVDGAEIKTFAWAAEGQNETSERVLITESVEATVEVTETAEDGTGQETAPPEGVREALRLMLGEPAEVQEASGATPAMSKRGSGTTGGGRAWADPGYQSDKKQRYDITTKGVAVTAWRYINQQAKAAKYTPAQLKRVKGRIKAALKKFGVTVSTESAPGWCFDAPYQVTEAVAEFYGDSSRCGSWSVSASNGPVNMSLSSWSMDPADLGVILRAAADAACKALAALDPDMDGDVDVPGTGDGSDTDGDGGHETAPDDNDPATESGQPADAGKDPAAAGTQETEVPAMAEDTNTTKAGGDAPAGLTLEAVQKTAAEAAAAAVTAALEADRKARKEAKEARKAAEKKAAEEAAAHKAAVAEALKELGITPPAKPATETSGGEQGGTTETADEAIERRVKEGIREGVQALVADGSIAIQRAGLVEHVAPSEDTALDAEGLAKLPEDAWQEYAGGALDKHLGQVSKRIDAVHT